MTTALLTRYVDFWEQNCALKASTIQCTKYALRNFERFLIEKFQFDPSSPLDFDNLFFDREVGFFEPIDKTLIDQFVVHLRIEQSAKACKMFNTIVYLKSFFVFLFRSKMINHNPMENYENRYYQRELKNRWLTVDECNLLLNYCRSNKLEEEYAMYLLLLTTGIRNAELRSLRYRHVDFEHSTIYVEENQKTEVGTVFMPDVLKTTLEIYTSTPAFLERLKGGNDYLFSLGRDRQISSPVLKRRIDNLTRKAGIRRIVTPHTFRYTTAKLMQISGCNLIQIQRQLRHKEAYTTMKYLGCSEMETELLEGSTESFNPVTNSDTEKE